MDSGFLSVELGFWIPIISGILDSLCCIPDSKAQDSGFHSKNLLDFWFQKQKFARFQNHLHGITLYFKKNWKECSSIQGAQHMVFNGHWAVLERNPGFVSRPSLGMGGWGGGGRMSLVWISNMVIYRWSSDLYSWPVKCDLYFRPGRTSVCIKHSLLCML